MKYPTRILKNHDLHIERREFYNLTRTENPKKLKPDEEFIIRNNESDCPNIAAPHSRSQKRLRVRDGDEEEESSKMQRRGMEREKVREGAA